jgi:predicted RNA-binding protein YlxR (DUF448 family)
LHISAACLSLALNRKAFGRALRYTGEIHADQVINYVEQAEKMLASK